MQLRIHICLATIRRTALEKPMKTAPLCHALVALFNYCAVECDRLSSGVRTWAINAQLDFARN
jgi:hypothetical protein